MNILSGHRAVTNRSKFIWSVKIIKTLKGVFAYHLKGVSDSHQVIKEDVTHLSSRVCRRRRPSPRLSIVALWTLGSQRWGQQLHDPLVIVDIVYCCKNLLGNFTDTCFSLSRSLKRLVASTPSHEGMSVIVPSDGIRWAWEPLTMIKERDSEVAGFMALPSYLAVR